MSELIERLVQWSRGEPAPPLKLHLQITRKCNLNCETCWLPEDKYKDKAEISGETLLDLVDQAGRLGVREWNIIGGEPLVRLKEVAALVNRIRGYDMNGEISTNGTLFTNDFIRNLVDIGWGHVRFSIDCPDASLHDLIRGRIGSFDKAVRALEDFANEREKAGVEAPNTEIMMVLSSRNYDTLTTMVKLCRDAGVRKLTVQPISIISEAGTDLKISEDQKAALHGHIAEAKDLADRSGIENTLVDLYEDKLIDDTDRMHEIILTDLLKLEDDFFSLPCFDPWFVIAVRPNGNVGPCDRFMDKFTDVGEVINCDHVEERSLTEIWYGGYFDRMRRLLTKRKIPTFCTDCCVCKITHIRTLRAQICRDRGDYREAIQVYENALRYNQANEHLLNGIGSCYHEMRQYDEAIAYFRKAAEVNPRLEGTWHSLGHCQRASGDFAGAAASFGRVLEINPYREGIDSLVDECRREEVSNLFSRAEYGKVIETIDGRPSGGGFHALMKGLSHLGLGEPERAERFVEEALKNDANDPKAWSSLGAARLEGGKMEEAIEAFRKASEIDGGDAGIWTGLASAYEAAGRLEEAAGCYRRAGELAAAEAGKAKGEASSLADEIAGVRDELDVRDRRLAGVDEKTTYLKRQLFGFRKEIASKDKTIEHLMIQVENGTERIDRIERELKETSRDLETKILEIEEKNVELEIIDQRLKASIEETETTRNELTSVKQRLDGLFDFLFESVKAGASREEIQGKFLDKLERS
ncbi:tetratricopeptide repeat protein [Thermodesulfobacteriota bacterium]